MGESCDEIEAEGVELSTRKSWRPVSVEFIAYL